MKIKYFIFGLLVTTFSVTNFSSADDFSQCKGDGNCLSCMCSVLEDVCQNICQDDESSCFSECDIVLQDCTASCEGDEDCENQCSDDFGDCSLSCDSSECTSYCSEDLSVCLDDGSNLDIEDGNDYGQCYSEYLPGGDNTGGDNTGGDNTGGDNTGGELVGQLSPVITGLSSAIVEIIPYIVYVGLGVLGALLGFVAIKWLINWIRSKILSPFK